MRYTYVMYGYTTIKGRELGRRYKRMGYNGSVQKSTISLQAVVNSFLFQNFT